MQYHHSPPDAFVTARFPHPKSHRFTLSNVSIATHHTPETIDEALALSDSALSQNGNPLCNVSQPRVPLHRSGSSEWWMEIQKSPATKPEPRSRKTPFATIVTDATEDHPAFESDAFAVQMPTTREPILDPQPAAFRAKLPRPIPVQIAAYQTYQEKAQRKAEAEYKKDLISTTAIPPQYKPRGSPKDEKFIDLGAHMPSSPPAVAAGAFPVSPPILPHAFPAQQSSVSRSVSDSSHISIPRKPVHFGAGARLYKCQGDPQAGATTTTHYFPSPTTFSSRSGKIRVRIKPKSPSVQDPVQKESRWGLYTGSSSPQSAASASTSSSTSISSSRTPVFAHTNEVASWEYPTKSTPAKATKAKTLPPKRTLTSRFGWLRPSGPRTIKDLSTPKATPTGTTYVDPFLLHVTPLNTPSASRPPSPKKLVRVVVQNPHLTSEIEKGGKFDTGFAQIKCLALLILKIVIVVYILVGLYFVLDAVREAMHALGAPVRVVSWVGRWLWAGSVWSVRVAKVTWKRWGIRVKFPWWRSGWF